DDANTYPDLNGLARRRFKEAVSGAQRVLAVSDKLVERTSQVASRRPEVAPIGIDLRPYERLPSRSAARSSLGLDPDAFLVIYVGHLGDRKGISELIQAMSTAPLADAICAVVGEGPLLADVATRANMRAVGRLPNESIPAYLAAGDVPVLPTYDEGAPTGIGEAGAAGIPVAASAVGGIPALLEQGRGYMFEPRNVPALVSVLRDIRANSGGARQRATRLRAFVKEHFDVDRTAQRLASTYVDTVRSYQT